MALVQKKFLFFFSYLDNWIIKTLLQKEKDKWSALKAGKDNQIMQGNSHTGYYYS